MTLQTGGNPARISCSVGSLPCTQPACILPPTLPPYHLIPPSPRACHSPTCGLGPSPMSATNSAAYSFCWREGGGTRGTVCKCMWQMAHDSDLQHHHTAHVRSCVGAMRA